jgi:polyphosphate kinase
MSTEVNSLKHPEYYFNRELSHLQFNIRVLEQSILEHHPLLERLKFLLIFSKNMDEFYEIRVAKLRKQIEQAREVIGPDGMAPAEVLEAVGQTAQEAVARQYDILNRVLFPELRNNGISFLARSEWTEVQREWLQEYFRREVLPVITPIALDPAHPFPRLANKQLNFLVNLEGKDAFGRKIDMAVVPAPRSLPRLIRLPEGAAASPGQQYVFLSSVIHDNVDELFSGVTAHGCYQFRITRDMDLDIDDADDDVLDLSKTLRQKLETHGFGEPLRMECADNMPPHLIEYLRSHFRIAERDVFLVNGPVNLERLFEVTGLDSHQALQYPRHVPGLPKGMKGETVNLFSYLKKQDLLLHHPFQSFTPVIDLVRQAARDPEVLAIRQTLYRTGSKSELVDALVEAARNGKEVTAVVEIRARFDEESNLHLARRLQEAGAQVVYGVMGFKTHCKILLVLRREQDGLQHYAHLGTGNYHAGTARLYTDYSLMTSNEEITEDVRKLFHQLTGMGKAQRVKRVLHAPFTLRKTLIKLCDREVANAAEGKPARIMIKVNSINEPTMIEALYRASQAGVQVELVVRGVCALRPGVPGVSENIRVRSVVGRFLEHTRVYYFENAGEPEVYCASADWMIRNLNRRVETCFPLLDKKVRQRVIDELQCYLDDNSQSWMLQPDGQYVLNRPAEGEEVVAAQEVLRERLSF